jgi:anti-anti-sigma factor
MTQNWQKDGSLVLTAKGRLDLNTVLSFRDAVFSALGEHPSHLTLDLSPLLFVEATGIATLVTLVRVAQMVKVPCQILPSSDLRELFQETGLNRVMGEPTPSGEMIAQKLLLS